MARARYDVVERSDGKFELRADGLVHHVYETRAEALADKSVLETADAFLEQASPVLEHLLAKAERQGIKRRHAAELIQCELEELI
jgi:hypothetical protein